MAASLGSFDAHKVGPGGGGVVRKGSIVCKTYVKAGRVGLGSPSGRGRDGSEYFSGVWVKMEASVVKWKLRGWSGRIQSLGIERTAKPVLPRRKPKAECPLKLPTIQGAE